MDPISFVLIHLLTLQSFIVSIDIPNDYHNDKYPWQRLIDISSKQIAQSIIPVYLNRDSLLNDTNINDRCRSDMSTAFMDLRDRKQWSYKLFDSWTRSIPSGMLIGTFTDLGNYDQCMSIEHENIRTKYCIIDIQFKMPEPYPKPLIYNTRINVFNDRLLNNQTLFNDLAEKSSSVYFLHLWMAICLPSTCTTEDIRHYASNMTNIDKYGLKIASLPCTIQSKPSADEWQTLSDLNKAQIIAIIVIGFFLSMNIISIFYEKLSNDDDKSNLIRIIIGWFSFRKNSQKILSIRSTERNELSCLNGIRFISMSLIVSSHVLMWTTPNLFHQSFWSGDTLSALHMQPLFQGHYSVDAFFYISGLLTTFVTLKYTGGNYHKFNFIKFIMGRYLRLTPQLIIYMLMISLTPLISDGPLWSMQTKKFIDKCTKTWWHNLFFIQNWINTFKSCASHTWYLAADFQFHILSSLLVYLLLRNRTLGAISIKATAISFALISSIIIYVRQFPIGFILTNRNDFGIPGFETESGEFLLFIFQPWIHGPSFFIGMIVGYYIHKFQHRLNDIHLKKSKKLVLLFSTYSLCMCCFYYAYPWFNGRLPNNPLLSSIIFPLIRTIWPLLLTLLIFLCITNNAILVNRLLSWPPFRPLSRITYSVYLTHELIIFICIQSRRNLIDPNLMSNTLMLLAINYYSYSFGLLFAIIFEMPILNMNNFIFKNKKNKRNIPKENPINSTDNNNESKLSTNQSESSV